MTPCVRSMLPPLPTVAIAALLAAIPGGAWGMTELVLQMDTSWSHDSNPERVGTDDASDNLAATELRLAIVQALDSPGTRLLLNAQAGDNRYGHFDGLNSSPQAYNGAFEWRWTDAWRGAVSQSYKRQPYDVVDASRTRRDVFTQTDASASLTLQITPWISFPMELRSGQLGYDTPANTGSNTRSNAWLMGARMDTGTGSSVGVGVQSTEVRFPERTDTQAVNGGTGYRAQEVYLDALWQYSPLTRVSVRMAPIERRYDGLVGKNFTELATQAQLRYTPSPLTNWTLDWSDQPTDTTDTAALYTRVNRLQWGAQWRPSAKTQVVMSLSQERQNNQTALASAAASPEFKRYRFGLGVVYAATPDVRVYVDGSTDRTERGAALADILQNTLRVGVEYTFENLPDLAQRVGLGGRR
ncbi:hypothetical protein [Rhodoferax aquaticus]|uniref:DUF3570 domain-containing protein n=1 Tax=Rhodoferax aquaticus TaxID=2527691 RepID=A0A515EL61_9BURK|nr:hypothetical protein [Rhodoferax aquaticus]QDL53403.1 hypothetical protein EXZ61_03985 [Rhodoferax aquaticus]